MTSSSIPVSSVPVLNVRVNTTVDSVYLKGQTLACTADGQPGDVWYEWIDRKRERIVANASQLVLGETGRHLYRCTAGNDVSNQTASVDVEADVRDDESGDLVSSVALVVVVFIASFVVLAILAVVSDVVTNLCRVVWRRLCRTSTREEPETEVVVGTSSPSARPLAAAQSLRSDANAYDEIEQYSTLDLTAAASDDNSGQDKKAEYERLNGQADEHPYFTGPRLLNMQGRDGSANGSVTHSYLSVYEDDGSQ